VRIVSAFQGLAPSTVGRMCCLDCRAQVPTQRAAPHTSCGSVPTWGARAEHRAGIRCGRAM